MMTCTGRNYPACECRKCLFEKLTPRLAWAHGAERAVSITLGEDEATEADITAWRTMGAKLAYQPDF